MENITVVGAGAMGHGIAHVFAWQGFRVCLVDLNEAALDRAKVNIAHNLQRQLEKAIITREEMKSTLGRLSYDLDLGNGAKDADLVVEAIAEQGQAKKGLFSRLDVLTKPEAILASNTSSISITQLGAATKNPERVVGMHFMNPVPVMKLVEVIKGQQTNDATVQAIMKLSRNIQKSPVLVNDSPGFVSNRVLMPMINEAIFTVYEGVAGVKEVDTIMQLGMSHPMGPLKLADFIGLDVCHDILEVMREGFGNPKFSSCPLLKKMVSAGRLGVKSGRGFYDWGKDRKDPPVAEMLS